MKRWIKIIGGLAVLGILAALYVWFFVYNKPHVNYEKATPDYVMEGHEVFYQYRNNKALADSLYTGKVLQLESGISKVETSDSILTVVFAFDRGMFGDEGVRCILLPNQHERLAEYSINDIIVIKGYCTGYNDTDIIIEKASIVED